jgi:hypothetical protein
MKAFLLILLAEVANGFIEGELFHDHRANLTFYERLPFDLLA